MKIADNRSKHIGAGYVPLGETFEYDDGIYVRISIGSHFPGSVTNAFTYGVLLQTGTLHSFAHDTQVVLIPTELYIKQEPSD